MDEKQISELLECSVCLERFDQSCKVLPCQHTFCRQCLDEIILTKHELRCPECRALVTVRVSDLPTNILVVRILEGLKTKGQRSGGGVKQHAAGSFSSSPSKGMAPGQLPVHEPVSSPSYRQSNQPCAKALYNYDSSEKDDLTFKKGDVIILRRKIDDNWFQGDIDGRCGYFPANFVQVLVPLPQIPQCVSLYDFELRDEGEKDCLSFKKDEILTVIRRVDENWLEGRKGDKIGIFPLTFVKLNKAARSLIMTKSNLTTQPGLWLCSNTPAVTSPGVTPLPGTTAAASSTSSNRGDVNGSATSTSSNGATCAGNTSSITFSSTIADHVLLVTDAMDDHSTVLPSLDAKTDEHLPDAQTVLSNDSQPELAVSSTLTSPVMSAPAAAATSAAAAATSAASEGLPQNKRHSFTSTSISSPLIPAAAASEHVPQRHSVEVTLSEQGALALVNSDINMSISSSSSSLPSSVVVDTQPVHSMPARNTPSSPVTTSEMSTDSTTSSSSGSGVQSGSLSSPVYIALYNYKPRKEDELELHKGDLYTVVEKCQDGWYRGSSLRCAVAGVFPGNYVQLIRHSSAFKPVNPNMLNVRTKVAAVPAPSAASHTVAAGEHRPAHIPGEPPAPAPPLMPRVAKMSTAGQNSRSPLSHLAGAPLRSLSNPGTCPPPSISPKHPLSHPPSHTPPHMALSRPLIPAPPPTTASPPHHSVWVSPSLAAQQHSTTTGPNTALTAHSLDLLSSMTAAVGKDKKDKKDKEKKGLVKLLAGKTKKNKHPLADPDPLPAVSVVCFHGGTHSRSASYPVNGTTVGAAGDAGVISTHGKAASFDASTAAPPPIPAKPRPKLAVRERYCCIVPYPPQTEHELSLELGDIIHIHRKREDGWYKGTQERTGRTGMFPASFVEKCD